jgi:hypothetical protein
MLFGPRPPACETPVMARWQHSARIATRTCREQMDSSEYQAVRSRLEAYSAGAASRDDVMPWPCDAGEITP